MACSVRLELAFPHWPHQHFRNASNFDHHQVASQEEEDHFSTLCSSHRQPCLSSLLESWENLQSEAQTDSFKDQRAHPCCGRSSNVELHPHQFEPSRPTESAPFSPQMGKVSKHLEGRTKDERIRVRQALGPLRNLTVQPQTRVRYQAARQQFYQFLSENALSIPTTNLALDALLGEYLEHLWMSGEGRGKAADTLAEFQDLQPHTKGHLGLSWRLLKTWHVNEIPCRAPPLPEVCIQAMVGWSIFKEDYAFGLSILVGFYGLLRTGELLDLKSRHVFIASANKPAVLSLGWTKGGKRMGAAESVTISFQLALLWLRVWTKKAMPESFLCPPAAHWRAKFAERLRDLDLIALSFRPYSLRRGGATYWFSKHGSLDRVVVLGRWQAQRTARIYINEGLATMAELTLPHRKLRPYLTIFKAQSHLPRFTWALSEQ